MPHPDILKVLSMTPAEWGALPFHDDTRQRLKEKAIAILSGNDIPVDASNKAIVIHTAITEAERAGTISRAGFEQAMIQQAKDFSGAVEQLRQRIEDLKDFHSSLVEQIKIMEDSRADFTKIILDRCAAVEEKLNGGIAAT